MSNCVHSTEFFFPPRHKERREQVSLGDEKDSVYRQMRERRRGQMRVKYIEIRHFGEVNFQKKKVFQVCVRQAGYDEPDSARIPQGSLSLTLTLKVMNLKVMDFGVKGCHNHIFSKIWTCGDSLSHISLF